MTPLTYTLADLQAAFQMASPADTARVLRRITRSHGFPLPLPLGGQRDGRRWSRLEVDAWFSSPPRAAPAASPAAQAKAPPSTTITAIHQHLQQAYG